MIHRSIRITGVLLAILVAVSVIAVPDHADAAAKKKKVKTIKFTNTPNYVKTIKKGKKLKLKIAVTPAKASKKMTFKSSNKKVATVSKKGVIKAKKKGKAYIKAYAKDGSGKKKEIKVIVGTPMKKITLTGDDLVMPGVTQTLKATVSPKTTSYKKIKWKSGNPAVATVNSNGKVTYKSDGVVNITAYAQDGSGVKAKFKINATSLKKNDAFYIAHRGLSGSAPENSLSAFELACKNGFQGVECDIWEVEKAGDTVDDPDEDELDAMNNDEEPTDTAIETDFIVMHDSTVDRMTTDTGKVADKTFEELTSTKINAGNGISSYPNEKVPSFEDYLKIMAKYPKCDPVIEIKSYGSNLMSDEGAERVVSLLEQYGLKERAILISFGKDALSLMKERDPNIQTMLLLKSANKLDEDLHWATENGIDTISVGQANMTPAIINKIREANFKASVFTINNRLLTYEYVRLLKVDYLTTNYKFFK